MFIELKCRKCKKFFHIDFEDNEVSENKCPHCKNSFSNQYLAHLSEVFYTTKKYSSDVEIIGLSTGKKNIVFRTDIDSLNDLFNVSDDDIKIQMTRLFDLFYLLMYHDAKDRNIENLNETINEIRKIYNRQCGHPENFLIKENFNGDPLLGDFKD